MTIQRWKGDAAGRNRAVKHAGIVYTVATAASAGPDIKAQTRAALQAIESNLNEAGSDKTRMLSVQIWLKDIERDFAGMNEVWDAWVPKGAGPARATGESKLAHPDLLVEILVTAAV